MLVDVGDGKHLDCEYRQGSPTIVYLHGSGENKTVWNIIADYFCSLGFGAVMPDLIGHGNSSLIREFDEVSLIGCTGHVSRIIEAGEISEPVIIAGNSVGGTIGIDAAARYPGMVDGLVLLAAQYDMGRNLSPYGQINIKDARRQRLRFLLEVKKGNHNPNAHYVDFCNDPEVQENVGFQLRHAVVNIMSYSHLVSAFTFGHASKDWNTAPEDARVRGSIAIQGTNDGITLPEVPRELSDLIPNSAEPVFIDGAHHDLPYKHADKVMPVMKGFLRGMCPDRFEDAV